MNPLRKHKSYIAAMGHRLSGLLLTLFLPFHFLLLATALEGINELDRYLAYGDLALVKIAEWGLVMLLAIHLFFGVRVLLLELTQWPNHVERMTSWVVPSIVAAGLIGLVFLARVF